MNIENYAIKNFRVFDENGVSFPLRPVSIITGCNSSGKSSIVKSVFLLKSFLEQVKNAYAENSTVSINKYKIDFTKYPNNLLGNFYKIIHNGSASKKITIAYTVYSRMLSKDAEVSLVFFSPENDELNNAYLESITISVDNEVFFFSSRNEESVCNLNLVKDCFLDFIEIEHLVYKYSDLEQEHELFSNTPKEIYEEEVDKTISHLRRLNRPRCVDVIKHIRSNRRLDIVSRSKGSYDTIEWTKQNNSFFFIPIFQHLDSLNKSDLWTYINDSILKKHKKDSDTAFASKKIIEDFCNSEHSLFSEYFKEKEINFLCNALNKRSLNLLKSFDLFIQNESKFIKKTAVIADRIVAGETENKSEFEDKYVEEENRKMNADFEKWVCSIPFNLLYYISMEWNSAFTKEEYAHYKHHKDGHYQLGDYEHLPFKMLTIYAAEIVKDIICLDGIDNMSYVSSSRADVKRLYSLENQDDFSKLIKKYFEAKQYASYSSEDEYKPNSFINHWIQKFGIGDSISVKVNEDGLGVQLKIKKKEGSERLLADEGYGITQLVSILLQIETSILSLKTRAYCGLYRVISIGDKHKPYKDYEPTTIAIEEPEIHLHPKYQSLLADMIVDAYKSYNIHFMIETHSEYLIRKLQLLVANKKTDSDEVSILYVNSAEDDPDGKVQVRSIQICKDGYLDDSFGPGFFDEATSLSRQLM
jgi:AAA15 family ATPase/GTPase